MRKIWFHKFKCKRKKTLPCKIIRKIKIREKAEDQKSKSDFSHTNNLFLSPSITFKKFIAS